MAGLLSGGLDKAAELRPYRRTASPEERTQTEPSKEAAPTETAQAGSETPSSWTAAVAEELSKNVTAPDAAVPAEAQPEPVVTDESSVPPPEEPAAGTGSPPPIVVDDRPEERIVPDAELAPLGRFLRTHPNVQKAAVLVLAAGAVVLLYWAVGPPGQAPQDERPADTPVVPTVTPEPPSEPAAPSAPATPDPGQALSQAARFAWIRLGQDKNACDDLARTAPLSRGGIRNFVCQALSRELVETATSAGIAMDQNGSAPAQNLSSRTTFIHYNPAWVAWMTDHVLPGASDPRFRMVTQQAYDVNVKPLATVARFTLIKLLSHPDCRERELKRYLQLIANEQLPEHDYRRLSKFLHPDFCSGETPPTRPFRSDFDENMIATTTAFWIRRFADGSAGEFIGSLNQLIRTYQPELAGQ